MFGWFIQSRWSLRDSLLGAAFESIHKFIQQRYENYCALDHYSIIMFDDECEVAVVRKQASHREKPFEVAENFVKTHCLTYAPRGGTDFEKVWTVTNWQIEKFFFNSATYYSRWMKLKKLPNRSQATIFLLFSYQMVHIMVIMKDLRKNFQKFWKKLSKFATVSLFN